MKAILFDFDGVIHDTFEFHRQRVKEFTGHDFSVQEFKDIHNGNFFNQAHATVKATDWRGYRDYIYPEQSRFALQDEIKNVLSRLSQTHKLFIITSGGSRNITDCLSFNGLEKVFQEVLGLESHPSKTEKFQMICSQYSFTPKECLFVTDTLGDILEANQAGITTIAVDCGFHDRTKLAEGNPYRIISHLRELEEELHLLV